MAVRTVTATYLITATYLSADKSYRKTRSPSNPLRPEPVNMRRSIACCTTLNQLTASQWHSFVPACLPELATPENIFIPFNSQTFGDKWCCADRLNWLSCGAYGENVWKGLGRRQSWPSGKHSHGSEKSDVLFVSQFCSKSFKWRGWGTPRKCQVWHMRKQPC